MGEQAVKLEFVEIEWKSVEGDSLGIEIAGIRGAGIELGYIFHLEPTPVGFTWIAVTYDNETGDEIETLHYDKASAIQRVEGVI